MRRRTVLVVLVFVSALVAASSSSANHKQKWWVGHSLEYRLDRQLELRHEARSFLRLLETFPQLRTIEPELTRQQERESSSRLHVLRSEIPKTRDAIAAANAAALSYGESTVYRASSGSCSYGPSTNPYVSPCGCESSTDQVVSPNGTYWGKYQFDASTWAANGGDPGAYGSASAAEQDAVAANVTYDAWPHC